MGIRYLEFPLIQRAVKYMEKQGKPQIDQLYLWATEQPKPHPFDTIYIGEMMKLYLRNSDPDAMKYRNIEVVPLNIAPSKEKLGKISNFCFDKLEELYNDIPTPEIFICCQPGLPALTNAMYLAGTFRDFHYISILSKDGGVRVDLQQQEATILKTVQRKYDIHEKK